ncbi:MAG: preprotein translocase subunit SecA, partial [Caldilinea sp.]|nr:preprotein translocase subunit SecA [Caldilinea sp.]
LATIGQSDWNKSIDMLKHGQEPTTVIDEPWVGVLAENWHAVERDKEAVRALGGLHVVGTERHEARRIDNQLRGRSGRLGDPGSSRFYLSLDDDLMRKFGGERISGLMSRLGVEEDVPIEAGLVNRAIENSQTKVEGYNFDIRKHVLRYDEVVNEQRNRIYDQRRRILTEPSLRLTVEDMIGAEVGDLVAQFTTGDYEDEWQLDELIQALRGVVHHVPADLTPERWQNMKRDQIEADAIEIA